MNEAPKTERAPRFEDQMQRLEEILRRLERGDLSLDDSVAEYERGIAALRACRTALDGAERKIEELVRVQGGELELRPFRHEAWRPDGAPQGGPVSHGGPR